MKKETCFFCDKQDVLIIRKTPVGSIELCECIDCANERVLKLAQDTAKHELALGGGRQ